MLSKLKLNQLYFKDTQFANLMTKRIFNVLLVANPYDAFMLEDDGRIDEKIFIEYMNLSLRYPPHSGRNMETVGEYYFRSCNLYARNRQ